MWFIYLMVFLIFVAIGYGLFYVFQYFFSDKTKNLEYDDGVGRGVDGEDEEYRRTFRREREEEFVPIMEESEKSIDITTLNKFYKVDVNCMEVSRKSHPFNAANFQMKGKLTDLVVDVYNENDRLFLKMYRRGNDLIINNYDIGTGLFSDGENLLNVSIEPNLITVNNRVAFDFDQPSICRIKCCSSKKIKDIMFTSMSQHPPESAY